MLRYSTSIARAAYILIVTIGLTSLSPRAAEAQQGRWKEEGGQCIFDEDDSGPDQCTPGGGGNPPPSPTGNILPTQGVLLPGESLVSPNQRYEFAMLGDGNLVLTVEGFLIWSHQITSLTDPGELRMQHEDGNLVHYRSGDNAVWHTGTYSPQNANSYLELHDNGALIIHRPGGAAVHTVVPSGVNAQPPAGWLGPGGRLKPGSELVSANGKYQLRNQLSDGNLVLYVDGWHPVWPTPETTSAPGQGALGDLVMQRSDGNLVLQRSSGPSTFWSTQTQGHIGAYLRVQDDGLVAVYQPGNPPTILWQTYTTGAQAPELPPIQITINGIGENGVAGGTPNTPVTIRVDNLPLQPARAEYSLQVSIQGQPPIKNISLGNVSVSGVPTRAEVTFSDLQPTGSSMYPYYDVNVVHCCPSPELAAVGPRLAIINPPRITFDGADHTYQGDPIFIPAGTPSVTFVVHEGTLNVNDRVGVFTNYEASNDPAKASAPFKYLNNQTSPPAQPAPPTRTDTSYQFDVSFSGLVRNRTYEARFYAGATATGGAPSARSAQIYLQPSQATLSIIGRPPETVLLPPGTAFIVRADGIPAASGTGWRLELWQQNQCCAEEQAQGKRKETRVVTDQEVAAGWAQKNFTIPALDANYQGLYEVCLVQWSPTRPNEREPFGCTQWVGPTSVATTRRLTINTYGPESSPVNLQEFAVITAEIDNRPAQNGYDHVRFFNSRVDRLAYFNTTTNLASTTADEYVPGGDNIVHTQFVLGTCPNPACYQPTDTYGPDINLSPKPTSDGTDTIYYIDSDAIGSVRLVTDQAGVAVDRNNFVPFGSEWSGSDTGDADRIKFAGKERDRESDLDYSLARTLSANLGRFMSADSSAYARPESPATWNLYAYAWNNPLRYIDPDGHQVANDDLHPEGPLPPKPTFTVEIVQLMAKARNVAVHWEPSLLPLRTRQLFQDGLNSAAGRFLINPITANASAGFGDTMSWGLSSLARCSDDPVDANSGAYVAGKDTAMVIGALRMAYAQMAKYAAATAASGAAASAARTRLKHAFGLGLTDKIRVPNLAGRSDAMLRASAGRTNPIVNRLAQIAFAGGFMDRCSTSVD